ncbi:MAG TPA: hypothetical protein VFQ39_09890, partial [Longimicrobium sp.]|nr:hypothetical protein [Longimicrobium sp.]
MRRILSSACAILLLSACTSATDTGAGEVAASTLRSEYSLPAGGGAVSVDFAVTNGTVEKIHVSRCGERITVAVLRREAGEWKEHDGTACIAVLPMVPLTLDPSATAAGAFEVREPGEYRFQVLY